MNCIGFRSIMSFGKNWFNKTHNIVFGSGKWHMWLPCKPNMHLSALQHLNYWFWCLIKSIIGQGRRCTLKNWCLFFFFEINTQPTKSSVMPYLIIYRICILLLVYLITAAQDTLIYSKILLAGYSVA